MITFSAKGSFKNFETYLTKNRKSSIFSILDKLGRAGQNALASATPAATGLTANSWTYEVNESGGVYSITWSNSHTVDGVPIAILLQYGHGTGTGGYVAGRDYINPALKPIFDKISTDVWKVVTA
jgi:hypothetical protein